MQGDRVYAVDWPEKMKTFPYIDILKVNEFEMDVLIGHSDPIDAAKQLSGWGVKEILVTLGSLG